MNYATWKITMKIKTSLEKIQYNFLVFRWFTWLWNSHVYSIQYNYILFYLSVNSWTTFVLDSLILPFRIPSSKSVTLRFFATCFFMNHLGKFPRVLKHSQEAEEMLKRAGEKLLGGSEECQRRLGNIKPRKTLNTCPEVNIMS